MGRDGQLKTDKQGIPCVGVVCLQYQLLVMGWQEEREFETLSRHKQIGLCDVKVERERANTS